MSVDFSMMKPRGHYTRSPLLTRYFQAMMWLGRIDFRLLETQSDGTQIFRRRQLEGALAPHALAALREAKGRKRFTAVGRGLHGLDAREAAAYPHEQTANDVMLLERALVELRAGQNGRAARSLARIGLNWLCSDLGREAFAIERGRRSRDAPRACWGRMGDPDIGPDLWKELASLRGEGDEAGPWVEQSLERHLARSREELRRRLERMNRAAAGQTPPLPKALRDAGLQSRLLLQVHDELLFELPRSEVDPIGDLVAGIMERVVDLKVPLAVERSVGLTDAQKRRVIRKTGPVLRAVAQDERSQWRNRELATERLVEALREALKVKRKRRPTIERTPRSVVPLRRARSAACWMTGPSAMGSENGTPSSIISAPAFSSSTTSCSVSVRLGSPAIR